MCKRNYKITPKEFSFGTSYQVEVYDDYGNLYDNSDADHYLEFEITIVENTKLFT